MRVRAIGSLVGVACACAGCLVQATPIYDWSRTFGVHSQPHTAAVATDGQGNVLATGDFEGSIALGGSPLHSAGTADIFLAKFDSDGHHQWSRRFGSFDCDGGTAVTADPAGNVVVAGRFRHTVDLGGGVLTSAGNNDTCLAKLDAEGLADARQILEAWKEEYNTERPHSASEDSTPADYAARLLAWSSG
jgi:transposase InsO family protein